MLQIIIFFVFVWLMLIVLQVFGMIIGSLRAEAHEKERRAIAQVRRMGNSAKSNLIKPHHVKIVFYPIVFLGVLLIFLSKY